MLTIEISYYILCTACVVLILRGFHYGLSRTSFEDRKKHALQTQMYLAVFLWILMISVASYTDFFSNFNTFPPRIMLVLIPPMLALLILTITSKSWKAILDHIPVHWILYLQSFRIIVELILWQQFREGLTPVQMTFEGRNFDIVVGLTAPIMAYFYTKKGKSLKWAVIGWNFLGLGLLCNVLVVAILSFPTRIRYFMNEPSNEVIAQFPFIWLPGILVTIAYSMHFFSLKQVWSK